MTTYVSTIYHFNIDFSPTFLSFTVFSVFNLISSARYYALLFQNKRQLLLTFSNTGNRYITTQNIKCNISLHPNL